MLEENNKPVVEEEVGTPTEPEQTEESSFLNIKYNSEEKALSREEAIELAQKGMNYDKIKSRLEELEQKANDPSKNKMVDYMEKFLADNKFENIDAYINALEVDKLVKKSVPKEVAEDLLKTKSEVSKTQQELNSLKERFSLNAEMDEFLKEFPDIGLEVQKRKLEGKPINDIIPREVTEMKEKFNLSLSDAMYRYEYKQLKAKAIEEAKIAKQNEENANASTGSMNSDSTGEKFFTREQVAEMTTKEINANWDAVIKSKKQWK